MVLFGDQDIRRECGSSAFEAGSRYHRQARVLNYAREDDLIRSSVKGSHKKPYRQTIKLTAKGSGANVAGHCSCPVGHNCKHVAAALLHGLTVASATRPDGQSEAARQLALLLGVGAAPPGGSAGRALPAAPAPEPDLPAGVLAWLDELARATVSSGEDYPAEILHRMIYVMRPVADGRKLPSLGVQTIVAKLKKDGSWCQGSRPYTPGNAYQQQPKYLRPSDHRILGGLSALPSEYQSKIFHLLGETGEELLGKMLETGRVRWLTIDGRPLRPGPPRPGHISWQAVGEVAVLPRLQVEGEATALVATPPVYVDVSAGLVGPIDTGQPPRVAAALFRAPPVAPDGILALKARLSARLPTLRALAPPASEVERWSGRKPVPVLRLFTASLPVDIEGRFNRYSFMFDDVREDVALARLSFRYDGIEMPLGGARRSVTRYHDGRLIEIERDLEVESEAVATMLSRGFGPASEMRDGVPAAHARDLLPEADELAWVDALYDVVPELRAKGWTIDVAPDFPFQLVIADGDFDAEVVEGSGIDWLELHLGVSIDGERVDLIDPIVTMISAPGFDLLAFEASAEDDEDAVYLPLADGRLLALPLKRLRPIVHALRDLAFGRNGNEGRLRLDRLDAARLAEFEAATLGASLAWRGGEAIRDLGRKLNAHGGIPVVSLPATFRADLRPYQAEGVAWLALLRDVGLGGVLADDMGLGKTVQALAFFAIEKDAGRLDRPALVVAPTSLMSNWRREAERFAPELRVLTLHGLARKALFDQIADNDVVLTTYPLIARDREILAAQKWHVLMLDEAQTIKNPDAATTKMILTLAARHRFCLTGTPLENHLGELWSLFSFACPGLLGDRKTFTTAWRTPIEKTGNAERGRMLARRVRPFLLRRTKEEVACDLPPKTIIVERIELPPKQRDVYETIRLSMHQKIRAAIAEKGWARSRIVILDALLKLRQACCDPRLLKLRTRGAAADSAKLERLEGMLQELLAENRRVIVFSQFTTMLDLIRSRLDAAGIAYALLTGQTRDRPAAIDAFQAGTAQVFLISLKAGGTGLNLVAADTVVLYDPWWNPAVEEQAIDRAHRIGQTKPVFVHKLVAVDTIEEKMEVLKEKKSALARSLFDDDGTPTLAMTEADIEMLLAS